VTPIWLVRNDPLVLPDPNSEASLVKIPNVSGINAVVYDDLNEAVKLLLNAINIVCKRAIKV
jgi:hypothetical protein